MSRQSNTQQVLRKIAEDMVEQVFGEFLPPEENRELVTSVVRQWITLEGHAALLTTDNQNWFKLEKKPDGTFVVSRNEVPGSRVPKFAKDWQFDTEQVPEIIHRLNLSQSAEFSNRAGKRLRMWVEPQTRTLRIEPLDETTAS